MPHSDVAAERKGKWMGESGDTGSAPVLPFYSLSLSLDIVTSVAK